MPELPDIQVYIEALEQHVQGQRVEKVRLASPFVVRSYDPPLRAIEGQTVTGFHRIGKRIVWEFEGDLFLVMHLMVAGRLKLTKRGATVPKRLGLCGFDFADFSLLFTEASKKKRASLNVVRGESALADHDPGGIDVMSCSLDEFEAALTRENHTLKRTLTDPHVFSGIGNAYSDEILHRAKLSPVRWTTRLSREQMATLLAATQAVMTEWTARLRAERGDGFPEKVTAFRPEMAVHGKYKEPCPVCGTPVQRIVRGESEINYCATCQTDGKLLADRALSRLLKGDWPKTLEELDERKAVARGPSAPTQPSPIQPTQPTPKSSPKPSPAKSQPSPDASPQSPPPKARRKKPAAAPPRLVTTTTSPPLLLFAHGAGASSGSTWMGSWARRLEALGRVVRFDYAYMREGRKRPDRTEKLLATHREVLDTARARRAGKTVLIGKSMGGRMGCHLSLETPVDALVCLGYPLVSPGKSKARRDEVLLALTTPVLFVQGTRDKLCPLDDLEAVTRRMKAPHALHVVNSGDHSLLATKTWLKQNHTTQDDVDQRTLDAIAAFLGAHL